MRRCQNLSTRINTNINAITAQNQLSKRTAKVESNVQKLASGSRINQAGDDAAGMAISSKMNAHIRGKHMAMRNANDAISLVQNATSPLQTLQDMVGRMRGLAIQSASDTYSNQERDMMNLEITQLKDEVQRLAKSTESFGHKMLNGDQKKLSVQIDVHGNSASKMEINTADLSQTVHAIGIFDVAVNTQLKARESLQKLDFALDQVSESRAKLAAYTTRLQNVVNTTEVSSQNLTQSHSKIKDTDYAQATAENTKDQVVQNAATSVLSQANSSSSHVLSLLK